MITHHGHHRRRYATLSVVAGVSLAANVYQEAKREEEEGVRSSACQVQRQRRRTRETRKRGREAGKGFGCRRSWKGELLIIHFGKGR
nr:hypothetical protein Itr_chr11CG17270 [Ipomoea trifida]